MIRNRISLLVGTGPGRPAAIAGLALALGLFSVAAPSRAEPGVEISATQPNVVSYWNEVANRTVLARSDVNTTPEEQRPSYPFDLATMHLAIYDALCAIERRFKPFAIRPAAPAAGASIDAASSAAAYGVLQALFPNRGAQYQAAYERRIAEIPPGEARERGLALGSEVARGIVSLRANDGRAVVLAPYVSGDAPGRFRSAGVTPFNRYVPFIKPFALSRIDQFRPPAPPALTSVAYADAFEATRLAGGALSTTRTPEQLEIARFHAEPPGPFVTRNLGRFASSTADVADAARLMAFIYVVHADAISACFEAKYHYEAWRPSSAIVMADTDGNDATTRDPAWMPVLPTPNHPEYPAAHSCTSGALGETLLQYYGTQDVAYAFDSMVTRTTRRYRGTDALDEESRIARIAGGMHFDFSTLAGVALGQQVARWIGARHFGKQE